MFEIIRCTGCSSESTGNYFKYPVNLVTVVRDPKCLLMSYHIVPYHVVLRWLWLSSESGLSTRQTVGCVMPGSPSLCAKVSWCKILSPKLPLAAVPLMKTDYFVIYIFSYIHPFHPSISCICLSMRGGGWGLVNLLKWRTFLLWGSYVNHFIMLSYSLKYRYKSALIGL